MSMLCGVVGQSRLFPSRHLTRHRESMSRRFWEFLHGDESASTLVPTTCIHSVGPFFEGFFSFGQRENFRHFALVNNPVFKEVDDGFHKVPMKKIVFAQPLPVFANKGFTERWSFVIGEDVEFNGDVVPLRHEIELILREIDKLIEKA